MFYQSYKRYSSFKKAINIKGYGLDYKIIFNPFKPPQPLEVNYADISFAAKDIPACGYKTFIIKAINNVRISKEYETDIRAGSNYIENKYYKVIAEKANRTVTIIDKLNNKSLKIVISL